MKHITDEKLERLVSWLANQSSIPTCRLCGEQLEYTIPEIGYKIPWECSPYEDNPDSPDEKRLKQGRTENDEHQIKSFVLDRYNSGNLLILELLRRYQSLKNAIQPARLAELLAAKGVIDEREAIDPDGYDGGLTLDRIHCVSSRLLCEARK